MQAIIDSEYDQVYNLAKRLDREERLRLVREPTENSGQTDQPFEQFKKNREELTAQSPERSSEEIEASRQKLLRLAMECPVSSEEDIAFQDEVSQAFRSWTLNHIDSSVVISHYRTPKKHSFYKDINP